MCTKRPDNYTLPTMKRETARDTEREREMELEKETAESDLERQRQRKREIRDQGGEIKIWFLTY